MSELKLTDEEMVEAIVLAKALVERMSEGQLMAFKLAMTHQNGFAIAATTKLVWIFNEGDEITSKPY